MHQTIGKLKYYRIQNSKLKIVEKKNKNLRYWKTYKNGMVGWPNEWNCPPYIFYKLCRTSQNRLEG